MLNHRGGTSLRNEGRAHKHNRVTTESLSSSASDSAAHTHRWGSERATQGSSLRGQTLIIGVARPRGWHVPEGGTSLRNEGRAHKHDRVTTESLSSSASDSAAHAHRWGSERATQGSERATQSHCPTRPGAGRHSIRRRNEKRPAAANCNGPSKWRRRELNPRPAIHSRTRLHV